MKILLITTALLLSVSYLNAQEKKEVDTYKIAFFSKDASGVFKEMSGTVETSKPGVPTAFNLDIDVASINTCNGVYILDRNCDSQFLGTVKQMDNLGNITTI